jgi:hypothetical protein
MKGGNKMTKPEPKRSLTLREEIEIQQAIQTLFQINRKLMQLDKIEQAKSQKGGTK